MCSATCVGWCASRKTNPRFSEQGPVVAAVAKRAHAKGPICSRSPGCIRVMAPLSSRTEAIATGPARGLRRLETDSLLYP